MRLAIVCIFLLSGCVVPTSVDEAHWQQDNLYQDWQKPEAIEGPAADFDGGEYPSLPFEVDDLNAAWGEGNYRLMRVQYLPEPEYRQGFMMDGYQVQGLMENPSNEEEMYKEFLALTTDLKEWQRNEAARALFSEEAFMVETGPLPDQLHLEKAWSMGDIQSEEIGYVQVTSGPWIFSFDLAVKSTDVGLKERQSLRVDAAGFAQYRWESAKTHSDAASTAHLEEFLTSQMLALTGEPTWTHGPIEYD